MYQPYCLMQFQSIMLNFTFQKQKLDWWIIYYLLFIILHNNQSKNVNDEFLKFDCPNT